MHSTPHLSSAILTPHTSLPPLLLLSLLQTHFSTPMSFISTSLPSSLYTPLFLHSFLCHAHSKHSYAIPTPHTHLYFSSIPAPLSSQGSGSGFWGGK
ncbi:hypothetical protein Pmani_029870 [Petrolisthes manimaculis]|uniref:Uncharacterized protein n=1 Tax=Petrolisthes manimaculis TaxID=1843537 RepID=A0AAE1TU31_9EUCA|nr:hypothetical protein Pmani_029870 [Petrolisthes manimaculis]